MSLHSISALNSLAPTQSIFDSTKTDNTSNEKLQSGALTFAEYLKNALQNTNKLLLESDRLANEFAAGRIDNLAQVSIAAEKANIALQFTMQIRTKLLDAYNEIIRMQI